MYFIYKQETCIINKQKEIKKENFIVNFNWFNTSLMGAGTKMAPLLHACRLDQRFSYYVYLPKGFHPVNKPAEHLLVVIHGTFRDAQNTRDSFISFAEKTNTVVLAPLFPTGIIDPEDLHNYKFIKYHNIRFDQIVLDMMDEVTETFRIPAEKVMLYGFSGGGQFVHRFLYLHPERLEAVVIGSPGRVTYLDKEEGWYSGIRDFEEQFGKPIDFEALKQPKILLFVGGNDTESIDMSDDASNSEAMDKYGSNRLERLEALYKNYQEYGMNAEYRVVPGVSHEEEKVTAIAAEFFYKILKEER